MKIHDGILSAAALLAIAACCAVNAESQTNTQAGQVAPAAAESLSQPVQATTEQADGSALIVVPDTSGSVRRLLGEIKSRSKEIVAVAPPGTRIGVVGINWEASKGLFADPASADEFIDRLTTGGRYTDLGRGNDAAMSLLQEAGARRAVVIFLTDGALEVPAGFKNRETFVEMLRREYSARPDVRVFVLNVRRAPLAGSDTLPANVTVIPLADWQAARDIIAQSLAPQIRAQLAQPQPAQPPAPLAPESLTPQSALGRSLTPLYVAAGLLAAGLLSFFVLRRRRRGALPKPKVDEPENLLREEDLNAEVKPPVKAEPVLILSAAQSVRAERDAPHRAFLRAGERLTLGKSRHLSGLALPELNQSQTLELAFDGESIEAFRLSPAAGESFDQVRLDGGNAPVHFSPCDGERISVGSYDVELLLADDSALSVYDTTRRTASVNLNPSQESVAQRARGGRLRRSSA